MSYKKLLLEMPEADRLELSYKELAKMRRAAYEEHVASMEIPQGLKDWADRMGEHYGNKIKVWHAEQSSWITALMISRYGEAVEHWPTAFTEDDVRRADEWQKSFPAGVMPQRDNTGALAVVALLGLLAALYFDQLLYLVTVGPLLGTALSDYLENKLIDHLFRATSYTKPTTLAVALYTAAPGETGGGTEVSGGSYARVSNNPSDTNWKGTQGNTTGASSGTGGQTSNAVSITFPAPTANWGVITHFAILDATSAGNLLIYGALTTSKTVNNGDAAPSFPIDAMTFTLA